MTANEEVLEQHRAIQQGASLADSLDALGIILGCPQWPKRDLLSPTGAILHDGIVADAKIYARAVTVLQGSAALPGLG